VFLKKEACTAEGGDGRAMCWDKFTWIYQDLLVHLYKTGTSDILIVLWILGQTLAF
jgi:hypothetical protein